VAECGAIVARDIGGKGMSDAQPVPLDMHEQVTRIERAIAETQKLNAETGKLFAEHRKLLAEDGKLRAEERKLRRDPWFVVAVALLGALLTQVPAILRGWGLLP
jgi:hypothetical protein